MKSIVFDAGPIISLATNNLLGILPPLRKKYNGKFCITESVKRELVDHPMETRKFKFEAIQIQKLIEQGTLEVIGTDFINNQTPRMLDTANRIFMAFNNYMKIVHYAEISVIAAAIEQQSDAIVIDEKTTRLIMENPKLMMDILRKTLHTPIKLNENNLKDFRNMVKGIKAIRSVELVAVAYEQGILDEYITKIPDARKHLLESVLWGVKLNGCAVSKEEIDQIMRIEAR